MRYRNILFLIVSLIFICCVNARLIDEKTEKFDKLRLTPKGADMMKNLHKNCYYTAVKAIIGKLGSMLYKELPKAEKRFLARCLDKIEDRRELISSAKCVVIARKRLLKIKSEITQKHLKATTQRPNQNWKSFLQQFDDFDRLHSFSSQHPQSPANWTLPKRKVQSGNFRTIGAFGIGVETNVDEAEKPSKIQPSSKFSNLRQRILKKDFKNFYYLNNKSLKNNSTMALDNTNRKQQPKPKRYFKKSAYLRRFVGGGNEFRRKRSAFFPDSKDHYYKEQKYKVVTKNRFDGLMKSKQDNAIISSITNAIRDLTATKKKDVNENSSRLREDEKGMEHLKWTKTYKRLEKVRKAIDESKMIPGAKVYEHRMYDLVLDREEPSLTTSEKRSTKGIMHDSMKLLQKITSPNKNNTDSSAPYYRALSPRFMPLMPLNEGKRQPDTYLSPTIMAMYEEPNKTNEFTIGSVPGILRSLGISNKDKNKIMQLVMDISGSNTHVDEALKIYENLGMFDEDVGEPIINATEKIMGAFKHLEKNLFPNQKFLYDNRGFAFLKKHQMQKLMRDHGHAEDEIDLADFDIYDKMTDEQMEISLWKTIENIANNKTDVLRPSETYKLQQSRKKRDMVYFYQPTVLSPFMFTVQQGLSIIGPLILSPTAFAPPILNPSIMSPWILSPGAFDPFILSPYILCPFILSPLAFTPFILTPYLLSPNILNPYLFTGLILSPIGLSPDILSPTAIGANILSPTFLSPSVLTQSVLTASVLSPSFLS